MYGVNIKRARKAKGLTQSELAERCGVTRESVSRIEREHFNPSLPLLDRVAAELEVTVSYLTGSNQGAEIRQ